MYASLSELVEAYENGDLNEKSPLLLDNDDTFVYQDDWKDEDGEWQEGGRIYNGGVPMDLLIEALELLGIPCEGV